MRGMVTSQDLAAPLSSACNLRRLFLFFVHFYLFLLFFFRKLDTFAHLRLYDYYFCWMTRKGSGRERGRIHCLELESQGFVVMNLWMDLLMFLFFWFFLCQKSAKLAKKSFCQKMNLWAQLNSAEISMHGNSIWRVCERRWESAF